MIKIMKLVKCVNGHFYDEEKFSTCPHCSGNAGDDSDKTEPFDGRTTGFKPQNPADDPTVGDVHIDAVCKSGDDITIAGSVDDEKTISIWHLGNDKDETTGPVTSVPGYKPVVGWLVCTKGSHRGESFNLYHGKNFVGRNSDMDVCLSKDLSVSRNRHAILVYEPKERIFFAQPGESHELFYVNAKVVLNVIELKERDVISIGETTLVFIPFCNKEFSW